MDLDTKREQDEWQKEVNELLADNENMKWRLRQYKHEFGRLRNEHRELMDEYDANKYCRKSDDALGTRLLQAEAFHQRGFSDERVNLANENEGYRKKCEALQAKCQDYEMQLQNAIYDLKMAGKELANVESYRQADVDKLVQDRDTLRVDLKAKKSHLQELEICNDELNYKLSQKEKEIKSLNKVQRPTNNNKKSFDYDELERKFKEKCQQIEELQENARELSELASTKDENNIELEQELHGLKVQLNAVEEEKSIREKDIYHLKTVNEELSEHFQEIENEKNGLVASLNESNAKKIHELNELSSKLNETLEKNIVMETRCNELEALLGEKEGLATQLQLALEERDVKAQKLQFTVTSKVTGLEEDLDYSKHEIEKLSVTVSKLQVDLSHKHSALQEAEEQKMQLEEQHENLSTKLREKKKLIERNSEELNSAKECAKQLEGSWKDMQKVCKRLKKDLQLERQEGKNSQAKQHCLLKNCQKATKEKEALEKENKELRKSLEVHQAEIEASLLDEKRRAAETLERHNMVEHGKKIQRYNDELKKRVDAQEVKYNSFKEHMTDLESEVANYKKLAMASESKADELMQEVENWQRKFDEVSSTLVNAEGNVNMIYDLRSVNEELRKYVDMVENEKGELSASLEEMKRAGCSKEVMQELRNTIDSKEAKLLNLTKKNQDLAHKISRQRAQHMNELKAVKDELDRCKADMDTNSKEKGNLNASFERERLELTKKLSGVLVANVSIESRCNKLEALLSEREGQITQLQFSLEDSDWKVHKLQMTAASKVAGLEDDLNDSKNEIAKLTATMSELEIDLSLKHDALQRAEEQKMKLAEIQERLDYRLKERKQYQEDDNLEVKSARAYAKKLGDNWRDLDALCNKLRKDLQLERQDDNSTHTKQHDLLNEIEKASKDKVAFEKENEKLKKSFELYQVEEVKIFTENRNAMELHGPHGGLGDAEVQGKKIERHNVELKKGVNVQVAKYSIYKDQLTDLENEVANYKKLAMVNESKAENLTRQVENWQKKFDEVSSILADAEADVQRLSDDSSKTIKRLERENKKLRDDLDSANFAIQEKTSEVLLFEKRTKNYQDLLIIFEKRNQEIKAKNRYIEETEDKNSQLVVEVRKLERIIQELEDKLIIAEDGGNQELRQETDIFSTIFQENKEMGGNFSRAERCTNQHYEGNEALDDLEKNSTSSYKFLHNEIGCNGKKKEIENR